eukprot:gnl/TRDRNA2_/TRDRNA2_38979_c0_seq1.p1 gnl/TRDRNA2_/TRDRNA2_38979_c0~~gnl/TRDRNA2_/TRDRNA2_38979_c0_seq1.p1  ORF type:complete len:121 (-),score=30.86 gnl/TRDRNA2_/TRDRNA2_38979_c0_seq1:81-443(-)
MNRRGRSYLLWILAFAVATCTAKPKKYGSQAGKTYWKKESECTKTVCKHIHTDENDDCVQQCVSPACWDEIYSASPLEAGEIDRPRQQRFNACVKEEGDEDWKSRAEERKQAAAANAAKR